MKQTINKIMNVKSVIVKTAFIDTENNLKSIKKRRFHLKTDNIMTIAEQKLLIQKLKEEELPKKYMCAGILENQIAFATYGEMRHFDFDELELSIDDLDSLEEYDCTHLNTFEHKHIKLLRFKPTPLMLSDLNEIFIILREVTNSQIKTRKQRLLHHKKSHASATRKRR